MFSVFLNIVHIWIHLLHCSLVHIDGPVSVSSQQMNFPEHHERLVVLIYLESYV